RAKGIPPASHRALLSRVADVIESPQPTEIASGVIVTGAIPRRNTYEESSAGIRRDDVARNDLARSATFFCRV
ncbi:MAG TPA: hypothetical protein VE957_02750, partial [Terriglobales bacterium]|nr:hypothetical protein [Terriglobales bacterium]